MRNTFIFVLTMLICTATHSSAYALDGGSVAFGCSPWDGPALFIHASDKDADIDVTIWGLGYKLLQQGERTITIDSNMMIGGTDSMGRAYVKDTKPGATNTVGTPVSAKIVFRELTLKPGIQALGGIITDKVNAPFVSNIKPARISCG